MKLKFVADETVAALGLGRASRSKYSEIIEELYKHPNRWIEYPEKIGSATNAVHIRKRFKDIEARVTGGNNLKIDHPDKKMWTLYLRYTPTTTIEEETF
jgi:hypothetical protein